MKEINKEAHEIVRAHERMKIEHLERELFQELLLATCDYLTNFLWYVSLLALGVWLAFYWMKHREEEEDNG